MSRDHSDAPERFLRNAEIARHLGMNHRTPEDSMAYDAIQGILNFEQLEAWIETEREIGPRPRVMKWLRAKNQDLLEAETVFEGKETYTEADRADLRRRAEILYLRSGKADRETDDGPLSARQKLARLRRENTSESQTESAVATDGGERQ